jgi:hypothetical protein
MSELRKYQKLWTPEVSFTQEDLTLKTLVDEICPPHWTQIAATLSQRINISRKPKQCRERWLNYLVPENLNKQWTSGEIALLFQVQQTLGNKWSQISEYFPGRSRNKIKNFFYSTLRRNLRRFNKNRGEEERIKKPLKEIFEIPEIRKILMVEKEVKSEREWKEKELSRETVEELGRIADRERKRLKREAGSDTEEFDEAIYLQL